MRNTTRIRVAPKAFREGYPFVHLEPMTGKSMDSDINGAPPGEKRWLTPPRGLKPVHASTRQSRIHDAPTEANPSSGGSVPRGSSRGLWLGHQKVRPRSMRFHPDCVDGASPVWGEVRSWAKYTRLYERERCDCVNLVLRKFLARDAWGKDLDAAPHGVRKSDFFGDRPPKETPLRLLAASVWPARGV